MNLRHAAAVALVGWYLMIPPVIEKAGSYEADFNAPLSRWSVNSPFDSASECRAVNANLVLQQRRVFDQAQVHSRDWAVAQRLVVSQCIASDDPRLKDAK